MSPQRFTPTTDRRREIARRVHRACRRHRGAPTRQLAVLLLAAAGAFMAAAPRANALELRLTTGNDLLRGSSTADDLYTFSVGFEVERGAYTASLRENAFTDREAGLRFDETHLTLGCPVPGLRAWNVYVEAGLVRVGHGLFGESAQNVVHRFIGDDLVELRYDGESTHARLGATAERAFALAGRLEAGPRIEIDAIPGLRSHAVVAAQARWRPKPYLAVDLLAGGRFTKTSWAPLEPHLASSAPIARLGVVLDRFTLTWSYNDYGDEREHLTVAPSASSPRSSSRSSCSSTG